ncbi:MAG: ribonuclease P protein component [Cyanobacteria bacterium RM1_2_2]|nr:ribonuclease P protein component [Cyanobacteria bacterium RM1_2_2]
MALPKVHRLRHRQDFSAVYKAGLRRSTQNLTLRALQRSQPAEFNLSAVGTDLSTDLKVEPPVEKVVPTRIGISISQKVSKRAVVRNRIKRQLKAILQQFLPYIAPGWQLVIVVKPTATECGYEQFLQELKQLLISAEVINGH